jgi:hypothetical protein
MANTDIKMDTSGDAESPVVRQPSLEATGERKRQWHLRRDGKDSICSVTVGVWPACQHNQCADQLQYTWVRVCSGDLCPARPGCRTGTSVR